MGWGMTDVTTGAGRSLRRESLPLGSPEGEGEEEVSEGSSGSHVA